MTRMMMLLLLLASSCTQEVPLGLSVRPPSGEYAGLRVMLSGSSFSSADVTISFERLEIEHRDDGAQRWLPLLDASMSYDLASLSAPAELAAAHVPEGRYDRLRIELGEAYLTVPGKVVPIDIDPRTEVLLKGHVPIEASRQTTIVLAFDADRSITRDAQGRMIMQPVIAVKTMSIR